MSSPPKTRNEAPTQAAEGQAGGQAAAVGRPGWTDRVPPHDIEAEMSLLGSLMLDREAIGYVIPMIPKHMAGRFYQPEHRLIYEALLDLYDKGSPVDLVILRDELTRRGVLEKIGGVEYLVQLSQSVPSAANAEYYAAIVRDKSMLRDLIQASGEIVDEAYAAREQVAEIFDKAEQKFFTVTEQRVSNEAVEISGLLEQTFQQIQDREGDYITGLATGFLELDDMTSGLQPGELIIVAARPSMGKTAFGLNLAEYMSVNLPDSPVAFFSMEMSRQQVAQRILCSRGRVDSHRLRRGMLNEHEIRTLQMICDELRNAPLFIDDTPGMTVLELRAKARRLRLQHKIKAVFVDYLQLMYTPGAESRQQEIAIISRGLKALGRELHIPIIAMAQLNRSPEGREGHRPRMSDLRESGAIEQDADVVMLLHRPAYYDPNDEPGVAEVIIAKQRNGPTGTVKLHFDERSTRFDNLSMAPEPYAGDGEGPGPARGADAEFTPF
jgi:replicative DNA helicase